MADAVDRLAGLPDELVLAIFAECAPTQLCAIGSTCHRLKAISRDDHVWRRCHTARWRHPHQAVAEAYKGETQFWRFQLSSVLIYFRPLASWSKARLI